MKRISTIIMVLAIAITAFATEPTTNDNQETVSNQEDNEQRKMILNWIETFKTYFQKKDFESLSKIYGDDVILLNDKKILPRKVFGNDETLEKSSQSKKVFLKNLKRLFSSKSPIETEIDNVSLRQHELNPDLYALNFHLRITNSNYSDNGWLFMIWDLSEKDMPISHFRNWQSDEDVEKIHSIFSIDEFNIE